VSEGDVGTLWVLQISVVPAGLVPVLVNVANETVVAGHEFNNEVAVITGATVPAGQLHALIVTVTESAGL